MLRRKPRSDPPLVGIVADDLSGASDAAAGFLGHGLTISVERAFDDKHIDASVLAWSTNTRDLAPGQVEKAMQPALERIIESGPTILVKKIDSTLRGHLALELELVRAVYEPDLIVIAPAFPAQGRTVLDGRLLVAGAPDGDARSVAEAFGLSRPDVAFVPHEMLRSATLDLKHDSQRESATTVVADAVDDADLDALVAAAKRAGRRTLWVGSGGLTAALARAQPRVRASHPAPVPGPLGPILVVAGSANERTHTQFAHLESVVGLRTRPVATELLLGDPQKFHRARAELAATLTAGFDLALELRGPVVPQLALRLELALGALVAPLVSRDIGVILTGGAIAEAVLDRAQITAFSLLDEVAPGIPVGFAANERVSIVTKAGGFGDERALLDAVELLRERRLVAEAPVEKKKD